MAKTTPEKKPIVIDDTVCLDLPGALPMKVVAVYDDGTCRCRWCVGHAVDEKCFKLDELKHAAL